MNELEFTFEETPLESYLNTLERGAEVDASFLLTLLEGEGEEAVEDAFDALETLAARLNLSDLAAPTVTGDTGTRLKMEQALMREGLDLQKLDQTDPLRLYLEELALIPAWGDIRILAEELAQANESGREDEASRMQLVNLSLHRVVELAGQYTGRGVLLLDLIQEGSIGLWRATECFEGAAEQFEAFRDAYISFYMAKAVILQAQASGVGQKMRSALEDYRQTDEQLLMELGRNATVEEIAERLHITPEATETLQGMLENIRRMAKADAEPEPEEEALAQTQAVEDTAYFQSRQRVQDMLSELTEQEAQVLTLRFGLEGGLPMGAEQVGAKLGMTANAVVALEAAALQKLRNQE